MGTSGAGRHRLQRVGRLSRVILKGSLLVGGPFQQPWRVSTAASPSNEFPADAQKCTTIVTTAGDMGRACGGFVDDVLAGRLTHAGQPQLDTAVEGARKRPH